MNFSCPACQAKYFVRDEDVRGRTLKLCCRRCQGDIPIQGRPQGSSSPAPPRAISSDRLRLALPAEYSAGRAISASNDSAPSSARPSLPPPLPLDVGSGEFYVGIGGVPVGPLDLDEVTERALSGEIGPRTYVWRPGLAEWQRLNRAPELSHLLPRISVPPPSMPGPPPSSEPRTLEERLGFGFLGGAPPSSQRGVAPAEKRVRLARPVHEATARGEWASLFVGLVISLAVGVTLGVLF